MVFHIVTIFTSIFTGILRYLLHPISHIFHMVFHMPYREIPSENAEPISQGFHMIIFTWYFTFLWNNVWKTMWNPCEIWKKNHMVFTWTSHTLHRVSPSSEVCTKRATGIQRHWVGRSLSQKPVAISFVQVKHIPRTFQVGNLNTAISSFSWQHGINKICPHKNGCWREISLRDECFV